MHAIVLYALAEEEGERLLEGLAEAVSHECIDYGVERRVGIRHAIGPRLDLVGLIVGLEVTIEALKEQVELDGTPANGEQQHNHYNHLGNLGPHGS